MATNAGEDFISQRYSSFKRRLNSQHEFVEVSSSQGWINPALQSTGR